MRICVIGAGVIGVSTAYMLGRLGHDVTVLEKAPKVAAGTSEANGAQLSYSYVEPLAGPGTLKQLPKYMMGLDPAIHFGFSFKPDYLSWGLKFIGNCRQSKFSQNYKRRLALAAYSQEVLQIIQQEISKTALEGTGKGKLVLVKSRRSLDHIKDKFDRHNKTSLSLDRLSRDACIDIEPALASWTGEFAGGLYGAQDVALDTQIFCETLKDSSEKNFGVVYLFDSEVLRIEELSKTQRSVVTDQGKFQCDAVVICTGHKNNQLLKSLSLSLPAYPMQGYSLTLPVKDTVAKCSITDSHHKIVFASLGDAVRIAGFMDANLPQSKTMKRCQQLHELARSLWPDIADFNANPHYWSGFRPMVPSGVPVIKETRVEGIYLNGGHGSLGYTFALGSAMQIANMIGHEQRNKFG